MLRAQLKTRRVLASVAVLAAAAGTALALLPLHGGGHGSAALPTAVATRGDVVLSVGGVGRIVEAHAPGQISVPAATPTAGAAASSPSPSAQAAAPADAVFPSASGHIARFLVALGAHVYAGDPIAVLDDGSTAAIAIAQARNDVATAQLELRQKQTSDPAKGLPPTAAELHAGRLALRAAVERAGQIAHPSAADVTSGRLDVSKARTDLEALTRKPTPVALAAAQLAVDVAAQRLALTNGPASSVDVSAARVELAKAQADLDALRATPAAPSATAIQAAQLAVTLAQQRIAELPPGATASEVTAAQLELKKAQADLEVLQRPASGASTSALAAAQAAVDLAAQRLAQITGPPTALAVASARLDLQKAQAELDTLQRTTVRDALVAGRLAVKLSQQRLALLLHPTAATRDAGRADVAKAAADLQTLLRRGGPASPIDIGIARLKVQAAQARLSGAELQARRLTVRAPADGTVTALLAAPGSPADPSTPVATVADLRHLAVSVDLSEFDIARVRRGDRAMLSVDALGGKQLAGRVVFVALTGIDNGGVVTFPVRVELAHAASVKPGMNVSVKIVVAQSVNVVRVPLEAVADRGIAGHRVTVVGAGGRTSSRQVTLGLADNKQVEIRSGLRPGERVLLGTRGG
jgi:HlyD family secretion protein